MNNQNALRQIRKDTITTTEVGNGLLNPEQSSEFFRRTFDATPFGQLHRRVQRTARTGDIDKVGVSRRILRRKAENADDNYRVGLDFSHVSYSTVPMRLPWEITEETLRENIEGSDFEDTAISLMTSQLGVDLEDLHFNGDTTDADPFLSINDGWLRQIRQSADSHLVDHGADPPGNAFGRESLFALLRALPSKYHGEGLKWIMSPSRRIIWQEYLSQRTTNAGDAALIAAGDQVNSPLGYEAVTVPAMPDDVIILANPQNFVSVWTYEVRLRRTTEGREAIMQDKRFYVVHFDDDPIIQEMDAAAMLYDIPADLAAI